MEIEQTNRPNSIDLHRAASALSMLDSIRRVRHSLHLGYAVFRSVFLAAALILLGASALPAAQARIAAFGLAVSGQSFDLIEWEVAALSQKARAVSVRPAAGVDDASGVELVRTYLGRASAIGVIERELVWRTSSGAQHGVTAQSNRSPGALEDISTVMLQGQLATLRARQEQIRPAVEQVIERQVGQALVQAGLGMGSTILPPVQFTFSEPPKKLAVSRRDRIETIYSRMLVAGLTLEEIERAEAEIAQQYNAVAYVTDIGGLGAYPAIVIDRASLRWILSTVAHEWAHNYLTFFPLGISYFSSQELTTLNENVAEIVGNEIGDWLYTHVYGGDIPPPRPPAAGVDSGEPPAFDFRHEMRTTRLEVDRLLAAGEVEAAEAYMEARRLLFVEEGYPIRVLNQAYFAFHGSYGTSPASTSPIGPSLERLRSQSPGLATFLHTVRWFTSVAELEQALAELEP